MPTGRPKLFSWRCDTRKRGSWSFDPIIPILASMHIYIYTVCSYVCIYLTIYYLFDIYGKKDVTVYYSIYIYIKVLSYIYIYIYIYIYTQLYSVCVYIYIYVRVCVCVIRYVYPNIFTLLCCLHRFPTAAVSCGSPRRLAQRIHPRHARPISDTPWPSAKSVVDCTPGGVHGKLRGHIYIYIFTHIYL